AFAEVDGDSVIPDRHGDINISVAVEVSERHGYEVRTCVAGRNGSGRVWVQNGGFKSAIAVGDEYSEVRLQIVAGGVGVVIHNQVGDAIVVQVGCVGVATVRAWD